jgi:hypothetical protein
MIFNMYRTEASDLDPATPQLGIGETILHTAEEISKTVEKAPEDLLLPLGDKLNNNGANTSSYLPVGIQQGTWIQSLNSESSSISPS